MATIVALVYFFLLSRPFAIWVVSFAQYSSGMSEMPLDFIQDRPLDVFMELHWNLNVVPHNSITRTYQTQK